jgi:hypothetical protein
VTYAGSGLVTVGVGLLATLVGLTVSVRWFAAVLAAACLLMLAVLRSRPRVSDAPDPLDTSGGEHSRHVLCVAIRGMAGARAQSQPVKLLAAMQNSLPSGSCITVQRWFPPGTLCLPMAVAPSRTSSSMADGSGSTRSR